MSTFIDGYIAGVVGTLVVFAAAGAALALKASWKLFLELWREI